MSHRETEDDTQREIDDFLPVSLSQYMLNGIVHSNEFVPITENTRNDGKN